MRLTRPRYTIPSLMIEVFVLSLALAFIVDLRERIRRKSALLAAQAAYQTARRSRELAESKAPKRRWTALDAASVKEFQSEVEQARADERARKAEYERLKPGRRWLFR